MVPIQDAAASKACIDVHYGENVGVVRSFFLLLYLADAGADYYAFCDQDDYWLPHKLQRALARQLTVDRPQLRIVLRPLGLNRLTPWLALQ